MGTRADFYIGDGPEAEWLGSVAWDGYPDGLPESITNADDADHFREAVAAELAGRDDGTTPDLGWPWPWDDSGTTDFAYAWLSDLDRVCWSCFGGPWSRGDVNDEVDPDEKAVGGTPNFPDMSDRKAVTMGRRSGVIVVSRGDA